MQRESLGSRLGFILISAGCAIGIGNVWKFPYLCGQSGGGIFVLIYLFFLIILGLPAMTMEFAMGRASRKSPVKMYQELEPKGSKWHLHGYLCMIGNYLLMMYYTTVAGWMLQYFARTAMGRFQDLDADQVAGAFTGGLANPLIQVGCMAIVVVLGFWVNSQGLQNGLEKVTKVMMLALLVIMVILAVNSIFLPGAGEGLRFYLLPSMERAREVGIFQVIVSAMNQAFFTLSIGIGSMAIFGSYIGREQTLMGESVNVQCHHSGHFRRDLLRTDHFPGLFRLRRTARQRPRADLHHASQYFQSHGTGKTLGKSVLCIYDIRSLLYCAGCI